MTNKVLIDVDELQCRIMNIQSKCHVMSWDEEAYGEGFQEAVQAAVREVLKTIEESKDAT